MTLRISGLVALMHHVRAQLAAGLPPEAAAALHAHIAAALAEVEQIARRQRRTPQDLPAPSYRAYQFLKSLESGDLPRRAANHPAPPAPPVRVRHLVGLAEGFNERLDALTHDGAVPPAAAAATLRAEAAEHAASVEALCAERGSLPAGLPTPSRRAYQWLKFASEADPLQAALEALALARQLLAAARWPPRKALRGRPVLLAFYPTAYLYRMQTVGRSVRVVLAPGYVYAPAPVLEAVLRVALGYDRGAARQQLHAYAAGPEFAEATMALEVATEPPPGSLRGRHYDLDEVFQRVNAACFGGRLARPRLTWSRTITGRLLGYYQQSTDRLMLSLALDDPRVPPAAIDLVMYHELLHKHLGFQLVNGRHRAHTDAFRHAERQFPGYDEAKAFLDQMGLLLG